MQLRKGVATQLLRIAPMRFVLFLVWATSAVAQSVETGIVGGVPLTHAFSAYTLNPTGAPGLCGECGTQRTLPYVIGPAIQIHLWRFLYLDAQGLYSRADYIHTRSFRDSSGGVSFFSVFKYKEGVDRWEVPILLKAQLSSRHLVHPFVAAGVSLQHSQMFLLPLPGIDVTRGSFSNSAIGPTFALGASLGTRWIRPSIEIRYTRWTEQPIPTGEITVHSKQDEVQLLAGLMFGIGRNRPDSRGVLEGPPSSRRVTLGIKGGLLLTDALSARPSTPNVPPFGTCFECGTARTVPYVVGPALEVRITGGLSVTAEAFYSRADYDHTSVVSKLSAGLLDSEEKHAVDRWEAPFLLKYSFNMRRLTPFISAGASVQYDRESRVRAVYKRYCNACTGFLGLQPGVYSITLDTTSILQGVSLISGPTAGIGTGFRVGQRIHPSIEIRYTNWTDRPIAVGPTQQFGQPPPIGPHIITSSRNQVQLLVGIMF